MLSIVKCHLYVLAVILTLCQALPFEFRKDIQIIDNNNLDDPEESKEDYIFFSHIGAAAYGTPKNESGDRVAEWTEDSLQNPEELGEYAEGDILFPREHSDSRNGMRDASVRWPGGIVPYKIEGYFTKAQQDTIMKAIADYHKMTCIRFVPYNGQRDYVAIQSRNTGCWSSVGKIGGRQELNLQTPGCVTKKGTIMHEMLHALGFLHEQSRSDRDKYVKIRYDNVKPGAENNFQKADSSSTYDYGVSYDYNSVMHYSEYAFSRNGQKTIEPFVNNANVGQRDGFSRGDVKKLNNMYNCNKGDDQQGWLGSIWAGLSK